MQYECAGMQGVLCWYVQYVGNQAMKKVCWVVCQAARNLDLTCLLSYSSHTSYTYDSVIVRVY